MKQSVQTFQHLYFFEDLPWLKIDKFRGFSHSVFKVCPGAMFALHKSFA